ncbi:hypothetical protein ACRQV7_09925 [Caproiciproducens sp. R2]|uniref:hypothetical protein n=1 Tax=Caproiciproducens sp. R2 TaxID=3435187 RepID=UPI004034AAD7
MNKTKKDIPLDSFTIVVAPPVNRLSTTCINIYQDGKFNMNGKLSSILGGKFLQIRLTDNCRNMCILEADSAGESIKFPQSGSRRLLELIPILKKRGLALPAKYEFWYSETTKSWQGEYIENPTKRLLAKSRDSKKN